MRHLDDGVLRRMVDEPLTVTASQRDHFNSCLACRTQYDEITAGARQVSTILALRSAELDTGAALARVREREAVQGVTARTWRYLFTSRGTGQRRFTGSLSAGALATALIGASVLTPAGSWAQSFVTIFQPKQVAVVPVTSTDLRNLPELQQYGTVHVPRRVAALHTNTLRAASSASHLHLLMPGPLPANVPTHPRYDVIPAQSGTFVFSAAKAAQTAAAQGKTLPTMPARINGSTLRLTTGTAVIATYGAGTNTIPTLVIGQMRSPRVSSSGVTVKQIEDYILNLPGISPTLAQAVRAIGDPATTLPIPIPVDIAHAQTVTVQGVQGLAVGDQTGIGSVVIWQKDGLIYGVGGTLPQDKVLAIAGSLH
ncbi:MAG: hypothetical protein PVSMB7_21750 [Chloroflexota bacterium]